MDGRSRYLYVVLGVYMSILGEPSVQSCAPYGYLLYTMYLFMADIANPDLFVCGCWTWICLDITRLLLRSRASYPVLGVVVYPLPWPLLVGGV